MNVSHHQLCGICQGPLEKSAWMNEDGDLVHSGQPEVLACNHFFHITCLSQATSALPHCPECKTPIDEGDLVKISERKAAIETHFPMYLNDECKNKGYNNIEELEAAHESAQGTLKEAYAQEILDIYTSADQKMMAYMNRDADFQNRLEDGYAPLQGAFNTTTIAPSILSTVLQQLVINSPAFQTSSQNTDVNPSGAATGTTSKAAEPLLSQTELSPDVERSVLAGTGAAAKKTAKVHITEEQIAKTEKDIDVLKALGIKVELLKDDQVAELIKKYC